MVCDIRDTEVHLKSSASYIINLRTKLYKNTINQKSYPSNSIRYWRIYEMTCIKELFKSLCFEVESELKPNLTGLTGIFVKGFLPQNWVFNTESETVTFSVDTNGNASVMIGNHSTPDVTIDIDHDYLSTALRTRTTPPFQYKQFKITFHTSKGKTAFNYLRKRLGL